MPPKPEQTDQQAGADRFWGQFSKSRAGRSGTEDSTTEAEATTDPTDRSGDAHCLEWCPICRSAELFKTAVSPELRQQAESIQHEAIGVLKAFLDAYADKTTGGFEPRASDPEAGSEESDPPPPGVKDIPLS